MEHLTQFATPEMATLLAVSMSIIQYVKTFEFFNTRKKLLLPLNIFIVYILMYVSREFPGAFSEMIGGLIAVIGSGAYDLAKGTKGLFGNKEKIIDNPLQ